MTRRIHDSETCHRLGEQVLTFVTHCYLEKVVSVSAPTKSNSDSQSDR